MTVSRPSDGDDHCYVNDNIVMHLPSTMETLERHMIPPLPYRMSHIHIILIPTCTVPPLHVYKCNAFRWIDVLESFNEISIQI